MAYKAFEVIGEKILIIDKERKQKLGIFFESETFDTDAEEPIRPALDFIEPLYKTNSVIERYARGKVPRERINPRNPILSIHFGLDHTLLNYMGKIDEVHTFAGELWYPQGMYINDGNFEIYNKYRESLKKAGFKVE
jgi:hypothetical protein